MRLIEPALRALSGSTDPTLSVFQINTEGTFSLITLFVDEAWSLKSSIRC